MYVILKFYSGTSGVKGKLWNAILIFSCNIYLLCRVSHSLPNWLAGRPLLRVATIRRPTDAHYRHIPFHFSYNKRTPVQILCQNLHWC